jgi:hypothetical protein
MAASSLDVAVDHVARVLDVQLGVGEVFCTAPAARENHRKQTVL